MTCPTCGVENPDLGALCVECGDPLPLGAGSVVASRYEIEARLGKGGMGTVYRARDRMLGEQVALKVLHHGLGTTPEMGERFRSEIRLARKVTHRNVCRIHDYGEDGPHRFISMQFIQGEDLRQELRRRGGLPPDEAFEVAIQTAEGLQAIHDEGIIHRDLKSPNIMRDGRGVARLMDFGIAKQWQEGEGGGLTLTGQIIGTPEYMSPEQVRGEKLDFRSDVYALGIVVFELFTGKVPFKAETPFATIMMQLEAAPPLEDARARGISEPILAVLERALAKDPKHRFSSAAEMGEALRGARAAALARPLPAAVAASSPETLAGAVTAASLEVAAETAAGPAAATAAPLASRTKTPAGAARTAVAAPTTVSPRASAPPPARGPLRNRWGLALAAVAVVVGGWLWVSRFPPAKIIEVPTTTLSPIPKPEPSITPRPSTPPPETGPPGPSASPRSSASPQPGGTPRPETTPSDLVDLASLDALARDDPAAALSRLLEIERRRPGDAALSERRRRWQAQLTALALARAQRTVAQAGAEGSLDLYARGIQELTRVVQADPTDVAAREALAEAIEGELRLRARRTLVSFVLSGTTMTGVTPNVVNVPPGMGEAPPGVIIKKAEAAPVRAKIVIEAEPPQVKKGETMIVRYYLENQSAGRLHVSDALVETVGQGAVTGGKIEPRVRLAEPQGRALLLESRDAWRLDPGTDWKTTLRVVLADGTVLSASLQARR